MADTAARVNMKVANNGSWQDAFQFGTDGDTSWSFAGQSFHMDVKRNKYDSVALFTLSTANSRIVVDDDDARVLHFNVPDTDIKFILPVGEYVYDLVMVDDSSGVRVPLMRGEVKVTQGVTGD